MEWSIVPIKNKSGEIYQYMSVQKDVSKIANTEKKLLRAMERDRKRLIEIEKTNNKLNELIAKQKRTLDLFFKYVPEPIVIKGLANQNSDMLEGEQLDVTLLFCDIRRFTSIAERLNPNEIVNFLNIYYSSMSEVISMHNGVVNQFVGDEIFICFGAPLPIEYPEISAVRCAIDMVDKLEEINGQIKSIIHEDLVIGIGINAGPIIAGNLGSADRLSYSITGDAVNTAKRIESLSRDQPNAILISQSVYDKTKEMILTRPWGEVEIKGKNRKVNVFQILNTT
jgi:class 3 adenylate cyclase